jgi:hypothetical protein
VVADCEVEQCHECRKRCRSATRSVSQADLANGLANRSGRAVYLSETRSDVRSTGARSRLREWLGRAALVKMCSRPEEDTNTEWVGASAWPRRGYLRKTDKTNNKRVYQFNCNCQEAAVKGSVYAAARSRLLLGRRASEARRFAKKTIIGIGYGRNRGSRTADTVITSTYSTITAVHLHLMPC